MSGCSGGTVYWIERLNITADLNQNLNMHGYNITGIDYLNPDGGDAINNSLWIEGNLNLVNNNPGDGHRTTFQIYNYDDMQRFFSLSCHDNKADQNFSECTIYGYNATDKANGLMDFRNLTLTNDDMYVHFRSKVEMGGNPIYDINYLGISESDARLYFTANDVRLQNGDLKLAGNDILDVNVIGDSASTARFRFFTSTVNVEGDFDMQSNDILDVFQVGDSASTGRLKFYAANIQVQDSDLDLQSNDIWDVNEIGDSSSTARIKFFSGSAQVKGGDLSINDLSGTGNAFACLDSTGTLYRSATACN
jgi:hypothetical protein